VKTRVGQRYRLVAQLGKDVNSDGTPGAPLLEGWVGTVKHATKDSVTLEFPVDGGDGTWAVQTSRAVSFTPADLGSLFERVED
jgi:hypothetical protein